jgi:hypothetical protein
LNKYHPLRFPAVDLDSLGGQSLKLWRGDHLGVYAIAQLGFAPGIEDIKTGRYKDGANQQLTYFFAVPDVHFKVAYVTTDFGHLCLSHHGDAWVFFRLRDHRIQQVSYRVERRESPVKMGGMAAELGRALDERHQKPAWRYPKSW